jgi:hypothetical protein
LFLNQLNINICIPTFVALLLGEYKGVCNFSLTGEKPVILPVKPSSNLVLSDGCEDDLQSVNRQKIFIFNDVSF